MLQTLKSWAREAKRDILALYLAGRDPRVPWYAKAMAVATAAYALSPIDLIPDFVPVLGYLDDLIILPLAILLTIQLIPVGVMAELRVEADRRLAGKRPRSVAGAVVIVLIWLAVAAALAFAFLWR
jgi:uncharacterized membrane protein YkvA (DUF1232 family)